MRLRSLLTFTLLSAPYALADTVVLDNFLPWHSYRYDYFNTPDAARQACEKKIAEYGYEPSYCYDAWVSWNAGWLRDPSAPMFYWVEYRYTPCTAPNIYDPDKGKCAAPKSPDIEQLACVENALSLDDGYAYESFPDYQDTVIPDLNFSQHFNSKDNKWRGSYSTKLFIRNDFITLQKDDGRSIEFRRTEDQDTDEGKETWLPNYSPDGFLERQSDHWRYVSRSGEQMEFDSAGKLSRITGASGQALTVTYIGNVTTVTGNLGKSITITSDTNGHPVTVQAADLTISYTYNEYGSLLKTTKSKGQQSQDFTFTYDSSHGFNKPQDYKDPNGNIIKSWQYNSDFTQLISSTVGDAANFTQLTYNSDGSTSVINPYGKTSKYKYQAIQGAKRLVAIEGEPSPNCPYSNMSFSYNVQGLMASKTDAKGNLTTYDYNDRGLETSRTEASGTPQARIITTEWHPTLFLKTKVTEPDRTTTYQYDAQGRQTGQIVTPR